MFKRIPKNFDLNLYKKITELDSAILLPDLDTLEKIIKLHLKTFPYQNTDLYIQGLEFDESKRKISSIEPNKILLNFTEKNKTGYCIQNAELLYAVLNSIGFSVERMLAKTINCYESKFTEKAEKNVNKKLFTHEVLKVSLNEKKYLIDTAYAHISLFKPLPLIVGEHYLNDDKYHLKVKGKTWYLAVEYAGEEKFILYQFQQKNRSIEKIKQVNEDLFINKNKVHVRDSFLLLGMVKSDKRRRLLYRKEKNELEYSTFGSRKKSLSTNVKNKERKLMEWNEFSLLAQKKFKIYLPENKITEKNCRINKI